MPPPTAVVKPVAAASTEKSTKDDGAAVPTFDFAHGSGVELPKQFRATSDVEATKRMLATLAFTILALHALSICPDWCLPLCWLFAALAFTFIFEIGHDCSIDNFFRSSSFNQVAGALLLAPLIQAAAFWKDRNVSRRSWLTVAFQWRKSIMSGFHFSHAVVILFIAIFFPYMLSRPDGVWEIVKYWFIPFTLFNLWMTTLFSEGQKVTEAAYDNDEEEIILSKSPLPTQNGKGSRSNGSKSKENSKSNGSSSSSSKGSRPPLVPTSPRKLGSCESRASELRMYLRLLSFLRFQLHVPSYHFSDAIYFVKRVWNRGFDEAPTGGNHKFSHFLDTLAVSSLAHGFRSMHIFDRSLSLTLKLLVVGWLYMVLNLRPDLLNVSIAENIEAAKLRVVELYNKPLVFTDAVIDFRIALLSATIFGLAIRSYYKRKNVYLVDFITYTPPSECVVTTDFFKSMQRRYPFAPEALEFMDKLITRTGIGENSYFPPNILKEPADFSLAAARAEAETVMFGCLDELFAATNTDPRAVDILIVNCSLFNPTPSLSAMIVNKYKMREDIQSYNLSGMGCSAGVISVHLAKDLLSVYPDSLAVVISTENITQNWYKGNERGMLVSNCLFRMGGAAVLLSNKSSDRSRARYSLLHTVRTHRGADDESYYAVYQDCERCDEVSKDKDGKPIPPSSGPASSKPASQPSTAAPGGSKDSKDLQVPAVPRIGVRLSKDLMRVAGEALKHNITTLAPLILPLSEQVKYVMNLFKRKVLKRKGPPYVPNFKKAVRHFCIHAGGRAVIEAIEQALHLSPNDVEPSKATLFRFGNTSSSSIWYELAYMEKHGRVRRSDKVWQIAFGSGFKCNSAVWQAL